jgi:hypothetical protein
MSTWTPTDRIPKLMDYPAVARNGRLVQARFFKGACARLNHITAYRRKWFAVWPQQCSAVAAGVADAPLTSWRTYIHSGHGVKDLEVRVLLTTCDDPVNATDPYMKVSVYTASTGILYSTSDEIHYSAMNAAPDDTPDEWMFGTAYAALTDNTDWLVVVHVYDYCRPVAVMLAERGEVPVDDTVTGAIDPRINVHDPIFDTTTDTLLYDTTELLMSNRPQLFSWATQDGTGHQIVGTTATNIIDGATAGYSASAPGFMLDLQHKATASRSTVPVVLAVYADTTVGGSTGLVKLDNGSDSVSVTGITTADWYTGTGTLPAAAADKYDLIAKANAAGKDVRVHAAALFEYE